MQSGGLRVVARKAYRFRPGGLMRQKAAPEGLPEERVPNGLTLRQRLAPHVGGALDLYQYADAGVGADVGLLARQQ